MEEARSVGDLEIAAALTEVAALMARHLSNRQAMSLTTASTLARVEREGPVRLTALAAAEGIAQPSMTQLVQRLEREGLIARMRDPEDRRVALVTITEAGRGVLAERGQVRYARLAELLAALPAEEREALGSAMRTALPIVRRLIHDAARPHVTSEGTLP
ncbi:MarR family winged helix-turn-helix transcriptional regulator [Actinoallomurus acaciae]|uniref:MarR family winged helix-turn-helix transcriptional regulator n=1 Tax=Actinoallomurus acaciae TaxID=502577 RepID=A0ABV5YH77_9ACTN